LQQQLAWLIALVVQRYQIVETAQQNTMKKVVLPKQLASVGESFIAKKCNFAAHYFQSQYKLFCKEGYLISPPVGLIGDLEFQPASTETQKRHLWITRNQRSNACSRTTIRTCIAWHSL
jgi:hypothetical protein